MTYKSYTRSDECILVENYVLKMAILGNVGILHDHTILDGSILGDCNAPEYYRILDIAVDTATVGYDGILNI